MAKNKTVSMRLTEKENELIKQRASAEGISLSRYMVYCATAEHGLTAHDKQHLYQHKAIIQDCAKHLFDNYGDPSAQKLYEEVDALWQQLK